MRCRACGSSDFVAVSDAINQYRCWGCGTLAYLIPRSVPRYACPQCGCISYNRNDVVNRYCGNCHVFDMGPTVIENLGLHLHHVLETAALARALHFRECASRAFAQIKMPPAPRDREEWPTPAELCWPEPTPSS
jgi:hypothetical protein